MVTVREAAPEDAEAVMEAHVAAIEAFGPEAYDDEQVAAWAERPDGAEPYRENAREADHFLVAERDGEVVGFGHLAVPDGEDGTGETNEQGETGEVVAVYVHGDHARSGVGSAILEHVEARAREAGLAELTLVASLNAVGFYERAGYERVGPTTHETTGGVELECVEMRKALDGDE